MRVANFADIEQEFIERVERTPIGYDPAVDFIHPGHANFGVLKLKPWRIAIVTFPAPSHEQGQRIWRTDKE